MLPSLEMRHTCCQTHVAVWKMLYCSAEFASTYDFDTIIPYLVTILSKYRGVSASFLRGRADPRVRCHPSIAQPQELHDEPP